MWARPRSPISAARSRTAVRPSAPASAARPTGTRAVRTAPAAAAGWPRRTHSGSRSPVQCPGSLRMVRRSQVVVPAQHPVLEAREPVAEAQLDRARGPVAVLRYYHLGDALGVCALREIRVLLRPLLGRDVHLLAAQEHDDVRVLLNGAGVAEVGEHRSPRMAVLDRAGELSQGDDRHIQLAREALERARDVADLLHAVLARPGARFALHELQVVDDDQVESALSRKPPGLCA